MSKSLSNVVKNSTGLRSNLESMFGQYATDCGHKFKPELRAKAIAALIKCKLALYVSTIPSYVGLLLKLGLSRIALLTLIKCSCSLVNIFRSIGWLMFMIK